MNSKKSKSILVPTFRTITLIDTDEIIYLHAMQNYCSIYKDDGTYILTSISFGKTMQLLEPYGIFQCHKSYALKLDKVVKYLISGEAELLGNVKVPIARRRRTDFLNAFTP